MPIGDTSPLFGYGIERVSGFGCLEQIGADRATDRNSLRINSLRLITQRDRLRRCLLIAARIAANRQSALWSHTTQLKSDFPERSFTIVERGEAGSKALTHPRLQIS